jgi:transcription-repair coupling factor (superfamily II helicase)
MRASPVFARVLQTQALASFLSPPHTPRKTAGAVLSHAVFNGLLGASRSLVAGALARAPFINSASHAHSTATRVALLVVDGQETALDAIADLRAFVAADEGMPPHATGKGKRDMQAKSTLAKAAENDESWADPGVPAKSSLPSELKRRLPLESVFFPAWDVLPTESDRPEGLTLAGRRRATDRLRDIRLGAPVPGGDGGALPESLVLVAPVTALMQPCESPAQTSSLITLRAGEEHDPILLGRKLGEAGYERVAQAEVRGEFALRGGILDIFPYTSETPFRIDFFGETIESIRPFDPLTQRADDAVPSIAFADASPESLKKLFSPGASSGPYSLLDHLPFGSIIVFQEPGRLRQRAELYQASLVSGRSICFALPDLLRRARGFSTLQLAGGVLERPPDTTPSTEDAEAATSSQPLPESFAELHPVEEYSLACKTLQRVQGDIAAHAGDWKNLAAERSSVLVFCETGGHRHRLQSLFSESQIPSGSTLRLVSGKLSGGFDLREAGLAVISDREILGRSKHAFDSGADASSNSGPTTRLKRKQVPGTVAISHLMDLQLGDHVVHAAHGIARYLGLARLEKSGRTEDYLTLLFANDVKLYVPAAHIHWVCKYIGGHAALELSTLGSKVWAKKKERAEKALRDIAEDLLGVQAARRSLPGIVYPPDTEWQASFEDAFPFQETVDQVSAIAAVKHDMQGTCPMDRLICGDVGFGKTEVALRAAFKAASSGKQVALLAPTTLLAEQHGRTFKDRFAGYPVSVEVLSRFKSPREQKRLLEKLATGRVDVVIGTHRLIQKDVRFKDLGLAIIDEEQRFGVEHKEFFKKLRKSVDVLTLTATPIPRTLHMALLGLRDISNLTTPPRNRRPITTKVARLSDDLLRRAILREISRGGQIFVVHPRVHDIGEFRDKLRSLIPEARFDIGHGQMGGDQLEQVMERFLRGETDVLVSTTIVESGLDIPSANTIIIHEADHFGLSELHQLRGRVGRSDTQAYCYLLLPENSILTPEGLRRLRALEEFDALGAGFQLALKDLEIRGAGNVLGRQQSGEIAEIGYDLYCKLLDSTVKKLRGEEVEEDIEVTLQLRGAAFVPEEYVQDDKVVLEIYRRLEAVDNNTEINALKEEIVDRFGPLPPPALRMFEEAKLRRMARLARAPYVGVDKEEGRLIIKLHRWDLKDADLAMRGLPEVKGVRILDGETLSFGMTLRSKHDETALHKLVHNLLEPLVLHRARARA